MFLGLPVSNLFELLALSIKIDLMIVTYFIIPIILIGLIIWSITWIVSKRIG